MYTVTNYKTKKALKEDVKAGIKVDTYQPGGLFPATKEGIIFLEGPHYPESHKWYAQATVVGGIIISVK